MKLVLVALLAWTVALVVPVLLIGGHVNTPACAHKVDVGVTCAGQLAAENERLFSQHTFPALVIVVAGYVLAALAAAILARRWRRRRS
jgi:hypothetical protein